MVRHYTVTDIAELVPLLSKNLSLNGIAHDAPSIRNADPANALYMLTRFACLACDQEWLEDLVIGAADAIETAFFVSDHH